jgi:hypothetical protein
MLSGDTMQKLSLVKDRGEIRDYALNDGRSISIDVLDDHQIRIKDHQGSEIGRVELSYRDDGLPGRSPCYHITWMYMDLQDNSYKHKGIGREALSFFAEIHGLPITVSEDGGVKKEDGSHLTADAPAFVQKMRDEGIVQ